MVTNEGSDSNLTSNKERIVFNGNGGEYFKIWIVNIFLSILTLGIYSAWAKVRRRRYFYGNTVLAGSSFEYHASPIMILKGRVIAVAVLLLSILAGYIHPFFEISFFVLLALLTPFVIWRSLIFNAKMSSYRNVRFGYYEGAKPFYLYLLLLPLLPLLIAGAVVGVQYMQGTLDFSQLPEEGGISPGDQIVGITLGFAVLAVYLLVPYIQKAINHLYLNGHKFGQGQFRAALDAWSYYKIYIKIILISILGYLILAAVMAGIFALGGGGLFSSLIGGAQSGTPMKIDLLPGMVILLPFVAIAIWLKAYATTRFRNYSLSLLKLEKTARFRSSMKVNQLFSIQFVNLLLLIFTVGLAYPWTLVRLTRYKLTTLEANIVGNLDQYVTQMQARQSALGEEVGEAFDLDLDLGI